MAAELVSLNPDVLIGVGGAAPYLKKATSTIPIVFMYLPDPVGAGLVKTIRDPGGNATGLTNYSVELSAKRLQYIKQIDPSLSRVALLINQQQRSQNSTSLNRRRPHQAWDWQFESSMCDLLVSWIQRLMQWCKGVCKV
jgi:ABC-type uncharacterized transport system substrate-binding protein